MLGQMKINKIRYAKHSNLALNENERYSFSRRYALHIYPSDVIYTFIPKVACSTMRFSLAVANGFIDENTDPNWIHKNINYSSKLFLVSDFNLITSKYTFVILRCPYKRLASAFLDKAVDLKVPFLKQCKAINPSINSHEAMIDFANNMSFSSFVKSIISLPHERLDEHFRHQVDFLVFEEYDRWFSFEEFDCTQKQLYDEIGFITHDTRERIGHHTSRLLSVEGAYSDTSIRDLRKMKLTGYAPNIRSLYDDMSKILVTEYFSDDLTLYHEKFGSKNNLFPDQVG